MIIEKKETTIEKRNLFSRCFQRYQQKRETSILFHSILFDYEELKQKYTFENGKIIAAEESDIRAFKEKWFSEERIDQIEEAFPMIRVFLLQEEGLLKSDIVDGEKVLFLQHVGNILTTWKQQKVFPCLSIANSVFPLHEFIIPMLFTASLGFIVMKYIGA
ncbi:hypothetical protein ACOC6V_002759 [Listeria monocytogenes]|uniref:Uncharacterized protein n=3 Tax=Listeria TaxID=1637 RepID=A0A393T254_LISMN|nr:MULTISPECIES: hypothetical protein [Listeria]EAG6272413.1 hypothetical protein [Listeria monocytogenes CFSAN003726]EAG6284946.1 hypothetical protein [Listeria monocytogenes CFSAN003810]EAG6360535.1 hypothetical protein [Listeria monocytogenes CFSAN003729]EAG6369485.1 hypothetical protein [Listeria monocytogenes CFSAN003728]ECR3486987.1 hypothetical protein [Listeria innocua]MCX62525.1 hypothetical protein [Listeria monocytogenes serotype 4b]MCX98332.1 hypothetical protein [Listeria monocy